MSLEDLRASYERELTYLRRYTSDFAVRYPKIGSRLSLAAGVDSESTDPQVERLLEAFALLAARAALRIDDDVPQFTEALLETLYPHYLRPFPSCSIVCFELDDSRAAQMSSAVTVPRGTQLYSRPVEGSRVRFRTTSDVTLSPLQLTAARFRDIAEAPASFRLPAGASGFVSLTFAIRSVHASLRDLKLDTIRLYARGEPLFAAALRDALSMRALAAYVEPAHLAGRWIELDRVPFETSGMALEDGLIPYPESANPASRLLTEFFAYPEKFGFFDCDLKQAGRSGGNRFTVHVVLRAPAADSAADRVLASLDAHHLLPGCSPVVNLFEVSGKLGSRLSHAASAEAYALEVDERNENAFEIYSIDAVSQIAETPHGSQIRAFDALHALSGGKLAHPSAIYWRLHRDLLEVPGDPGQEVTLDFVDEHLAPASPPASLDVALTCSNRDLAERLEFGSPNGDLMMEGGSLARRINLLHKPTQRMRFRHGHGARWRLISLLSTNAAALVDGPGPVREWLELHDLAGSAISARQIQGVLSVQRKVVTAWVPDQPFASFVRGVEIRLVIDEAAFAGASVHVFAQVMDRLFRLHVTMSFFTQLIVLSGDSDEVLLTCPRRLGHGAPV